MEDNLLQYISEACSSKGRQLGPETFWHKGKASPLVLAGQHGHVEVVEYLLDTVPLHPGGFVDQTATISFDKDAQKIHHCTALSAASMGGHLRTVKLLLSGASVDIPDCLEATSFCEATFHGHIHILKALSIWGVISAKTFP